MSSVRFDDLRHTAFLRTRIGRIEFLPIPDPLQGECHAADENADTGSDGDVGKRLTFGHGAHRACCMRSRAWRQYFTNQRFASGVSFAGWSCVRFGFSNQSLVAGTERKLGIDEPKR